MNEINFSIGKVYHAELTYKEHSDGDERVFAHQGWRVVGITLDETLTKKFVRFEVVKNQCCPEPDFPLGKRITAVAYLDTFNGVTSEVCVRVANKRVHGFCVYSDKTYEEYLKRDSEAAVNDLLNGSVTKNGKEG